MSDRIQLREEHDEEAQRQFAVRLAFNLCGTDTLFREGDKLASPTTPGPARHSRWARQFEPLELGRDYFQRAP